MRHFTNYVSVFLLFSFIGWLIELAYRSIRNKRLINPGFMVGVCLPIYGTGGLILYLIFDTELSFINSDILEITLKVIVSSILLTLIEFISGYISLKYYHNRLWDYSDRKFNIMGIICPQFSLAWAVLVIIFYFTCYPWVGGFASYIYEHEVTFLMLGMTMGIFLVDLGYSLKVMDKLRNYAKQVEKTIDFEAFKVSVRERTQNGLKKIKSFSIFKLAHRISAYLDEQNHRNSEKNSDIK